jgi:hypothetical protein
VSDPTEPPITIELTLEEAERLFSALEDTADFLARLMAHDRLQVADLLPAFAAIEYQLSVLSLKLGYRQGGDGAC